MVTPWRIELDQPTFVRMLVNKFGQLVSNIQDFRRTDLMDKLNCDNSQLAENKLPANSVDGIHSSSSIGLHTVVFVCMFSSLESIRVLKQMFGLFLLTVFVVQTSI